MGTSLQALTSVCVGGLKWLLLYPENLVPYLVCLFRSLEVKFDRQLLSLRTRVPVSLISVALSSLGYAPAFVGGAQTPFPKSNWLLSLGEKRYKVLTMTMKDLNLFFCRTSCATFLTCGGKKFNE